MSDYDKVVSTVLRIVRTRYESAGTAFPVPLLAAEVKKECGYDNTRRIPVIVGVMVASGVLVGVRNSRGTVTSVRPKQGGEGREQMKKEAFGTGNFQNQQNFTKFATEAYEKVKKEMLPQFEDLGKKLKAAEDKARAAEVAAAEARGKERVVEVQLKNGTKVVKRVKGLFHAKFPRLLDLAKARRNIFIYGPTGSGKTFVCEQLAEALGLPFSFISCTSGMSEGQLVGKLLPVEAGGKFGYVPAEYVLRYEQGGVFLFDEIDASDPNTLLIANTSIAGNKMAVYNRPKKPYAVKHKDFICIAAANTVGTGADRLYAGRNKLDASTLDRFQVGKVFLDYDKQVEEQLCPDDTIRYKLWGYREAIAQHGLERAISTRFLIDAYLMASGYEWSFNDIEDSLFCGWREDEINRVKAYYRQHEHKFKPPVKLAAMDAGVE